MEDLIAIQINGPDEPGIFTQLCNFFAERNINIEDVSQSVLQGYLSITFIVNITRATLNVDRMSLEIKKLCRTMNVSASVFPYKEGYRPSKKLLYIFTMMGKDRSGILSRISENLSKNNANIETIKLRSRQGWIFTQLILDLSGVGDIETMRNELRMICEDLELSMSLQEERKYRVNKKLVVFDMDSTLVTGETIVDVARRIGKEKEMHEATELAMSSDMDFKDSLRSRSKLLTGVEEDLLMQVAAELEITPGADALVNKLKDQGYRIALISSGFSYFTDVVKERLGLDYSFGNTLEIRDGRVTGNVVGEIIDGEGKWQIISDLCEELGIDQQEVVTIGDGSNDRVMLHRSGLGIGLNSKEIASRVADGKVTIEDVEMILLLLGLSETDIDSFFD